MICATSQGNKNSDKNSSQMFYYSQSFRRSEKSNIFVQKGETNEKRFQSQLRATGAYKYDRGGASSSVLMRCTVTAIQDVNNNVDLNPRMKM